MESNEDLMRTGPDVTSCALLEIISFFIEKEKYFQIIYQEEEEENKRETVHPTNNCNVHDGIFVFSDTQGLTVEQSLVVSMENGFAGESKLTLNTA
jgi:hypothetical protein